MSTGLSWGILLAAFAGLCFLALTIGVMVLVFRAAARSSGRPPGEAQRDDSGNVILPAAIGADSLTNPANPLYHLHHPASPSDDATRHHSIDPGSSPSTFDASPSPSFDSGSSSPPSVDTGGSGCG